MNNFFKSFRSNKNTHPDISCEDAITNVFWSQFQKYGPKDLNEKPGYFENWLFFERRGFSSTVIFNNQPQCGLSSDRFSFNEGRLKELLESRKPEKVNINISKFNIDDQEKNFPHLDIKMDYKRK
jgi:hypothetical protein